LITDLFTFTVGKKRDMAELASPVIVAWPITTSRI